MVRKIKHIWSSRQNSPARSAIFIGAPDDRGVLNVGGRLGASHGPEGARNMLSGFMLGMSGALSKINLSQGFDVETGATIEAGHAALRAAVNNSLRSNALPIVLGGGHDYGYPHVAGAFDALSGGGKKKIALINVDAHLDVRPPNENGITSGSPFFLALEEGVVRPENFVEFGIQDHCNDQSYFEYVSKKRVSVVTLDEARAGRGVAERFSKLLSKFSNNNDVQIVVSFDVDAVQMAHAPGVSAPQIDGFTPAEFLAMASLCGECPNVATIGFFEFAPSLDEGAKTARLVATAIHRFLTGFSQRGEKKKTGRRLAVRRLLGRR